MVVEDSQKSTITDDQNPSRVDNDDDDLEDGEILEDADDAASAASKPPSALLRNPHPLENSWTFWFHSPSAKSKQAKWGSSIRPIYTFATVEEFWSIYNNIHHPSKLGVWADFHCFKYKIEPKWEDPICANGGKWTMTFQRGKSDTSWLYTLLAMIGEQFDHGDEICGAVVNVRSRQDKISIWTKNASNEAAQMSIGKQWKEFLDYNETIAFYNEQMFTGLDFVISEARKYGIKLILSLVNNYENFGGKKQYVNWARSHGQYLTSDDDFFRSPVVKGYYMNHVRTVLNRYNRFTGIHYKDDPTIMAWELMNEPRCTSDPSGRTIQAWITEMAWFVKSIDRNHLLEAGLEGFYGQSTPQRKRLNPGFNIGTDFIANNRIPAIDFATVHCYPDQWVSSSNVQYQLSFLNNWLSAHFMDAQYAIRKPILVAEFGKSFRGSGYEAYERDEVFNAVYYKVYASAKRGGAAGGALFWQLLTGGMESFQDGYGIMLGQSSSTADLIARQSRKLYLIRKIFARVANMRRWRRGRSNKGFSGSGGGNGGSHVGN